MTVKASELRPEDLRLGNLVEQGVISSICYVQGRIGCWITESVYDSSPGTFYGIEEIMPIPLTEEWLKVFSFYQLSHYTVTNSWLYNLGRGRLLCIGCVGTPNLMVMLQEIQDKETMAVEQVVLHNWDYDGEIYVHQVQNLIRDLERKEKLALTGEELKGK